MKNTRLHTRFVFIAIILMLAMPMALSAQGRDGIGLGVIVGQPTGLSAISWLGGGNALGFRFYFQCHATTHQNYDHCKTAVCVAKAHFADFVTSSERVSMI